VWKYELCRHGNEQVRDYTSGETRGFQLSSPSMTSYKKINPSYRVIYLDPDTFEPLDMDTYHLDLKVNAGNVEYLLNKQVTYLFEVCRWNEVARD
jgi:hypothetical protein